MSASSHRYYVCHEPSVGSDILRAAIHSEIEGFSLQVFSRAGDGRLVQQSCSRSIGTSKAIQNAAQIADRPASMVGLGAALGAAVAGALFLPLLYSIGRWPFLGLMFIATLIAAWAGGAFSMPVAAVAIRRRLKKLKPEELFIVCRAADDAQSSIEKVLSRYSVVATSELQATTVAPQDSGRA